MLTLSYNCLLYTNTYKVKLVSGYWINVTVYLYLQCFRCLIHTYLRLCIVSRGGGHSHRHPNTFRQVTVLDFILLCSSFSSWRSNFFIRPVARRPPSSNRASNKWHVHAIGTCRDPTSNIVASFRSPQSTSPKRRPPSPRITIIDPPAHLRAYTCHAATSRNCR